MKKLIAAMLACLILLSPLLTLADDEPSPTLPRKSTLVSNGLSLSEFPIDCMPMELMRVDLDPEAIACNNGAEAYIGLFYLPDNLAYVILTDGFHIIYGEFERYVDDILYVSFQKYDLAVMDGTKGLWLVLIQEIE